MKHSSSIQLILPLTLLLILTTYGCKTAQDIEREQLVVELHTNVQKDKAQLDQSQRMIAEMTQELAEKKQQMFELQGQIDEDKSALKHMENSITALKEDMRILEENTSMQYQELKKYMNDIVNGLKKIHKSVGAAGNPNSPKDSNLSNALEFYKNGKYDKAKPLFLQILKDPKLDKAIRNRIYNNLGSIGFAQNDCEQSMVYFSKLFTMDPASVYAPNSLLHIGRCFVKLNKIPEAKAAYSQLISKYPTSSKVAAAQEELKAIP